jgi:hypothetical protein
MIIKYLLSKENDIANDIVYKWEKDVTSTELGDAATHANRNKRIAASVSFLPWHINVRGCDDGLRSVSQWIDVLKSSYGLFHGVDLSFDRHTIDRRL